MSVVIGNEYDHIDYTSQGITTRHPFKDPSSRQMIGDLNNLNTSDDSNLVSAINEVRTKSMNNPGLIGVSAPVSAIVNALRHGYIDSIPIGITFTVPHDVYGDITFAVRAKNQHLCSDDATKPTLTIQPIYALSNNGGSTAATFTYDRAEAFYKVKDYTIYAGSICRFSMPTVYGRWEPGMYVFTVTSDIPVGSKLCIAGSQSQTLTNCTVRAYTDYTGTTATGAYSIGSYHGTSTVNLGTLGANNGCNHYQRVLNGSNNEAQSNLFQWLNTDSGSSNMDTVFVEQSDFDMMDLSFRNKKGFLGGFSDEFRSYLGLAVIHNFTNSTYETNGYGINASYVHQGYFFLPSQKEIFGVNAGQYDTDDIQFTYYRDVLTTANDRKIRARGSASSNYGWLRTPMSSSDSVRYGDNAGTNASSSRSIAPLAILA